MAELQLDMATPERVELSLPVAGIGYRSLAYIVDVLLVLCGWAVIYFLYVLVGPPPIILWESMLSLLRILTVIAVFFFQWVYWTAFEVLRSGQTPGKRALGIRIVRLDGSPVGVFESAVRNLLRLVDFLPGLYGVGVVSMLIDSKHRRLGDLAAGTIALREQKIDLDRYRTSGEAAASATGRPLSAQELEMLSALSARFNLLEPDARLTLGRKLAAKVGDDASSLVDDAALRAWLTRRLT